jgi:hypothetical protein
MQDVCALPDVTYKVAIIENGDGGLAIEKYPFFQDIV